MKTKTGILVVGAAGLFLLGRWLKETTPLSGSLPDPGRSTEGPTPISGLSPSPRAQERGLPVVKMCNCNPEACTSKTQCFDPIQHHEATCNKRSVAEMWRRQRATSSANSLPGF